MSALDFQAAKAKRERDLDEARQQGMLQARRYYLTERPGGFWVGFVCGVLLSVLAAAVARTL